MIMGNSVLVVDDDQVSIHLLKLILERGGYNVVGARSAAAGLEMLRTLRPLVILIDDMMPQMTGGEMCSIIKDDPDFWDTPVILLSAGTRVESASYINQVGADFALTKPLISRDVLNAVEQALADKTA